MLTPLSSAQGRGRPLILGPAQTQGARALPQRLGRAWAGGAAVGGWDDQAQGTPSLWCPEREAGRSAASSPGLVLWRELDGVCEVVLCVPILGREERSQSPPLRGREHHLPRLLVADGAGFLSPPSVLLGNRPSAEPLVTSPPSVLTSSRVSQEPRAVGWLGQGPGVLTSEQVP